MMKYPAFLALSFAFLVANVFASEPDLKAPNPVIYLSDNLDENQNLGWCIDTVGRGYNDQLHAHSCKPQGGDVQFKFLAGTSQIQSVEYPEKCVALVDESSEKLPFGLVDCDAASTSQMFTYHADTLKITLASDTEKCMAVGAQSRSAGPFMSRDLIIGNCADLPKTHMQWRSNID
ncbi:MAG: ricin-type beta-trefoil lectin domain protein [Lentilitoribacter sp.]